METAIWVALGVLVLVILLIGGRAIKTIDPLAPHSWWERYRDDSEPKRRDDGA